MILARKKWVKWGNRPLGEKFELINYSRQFMSQNNYYEPQNHESLMVIHSATQKRISWAWKNEEKTTEHVKDKTHEGSAT